MKIKIKHIYTGNESEFDTDNYHIAVQMTPTDLENIKSLPDTEDGRSIEGNEHRTYACIRPADDTESDALFAWAKQ
ncbi:hypothetical protein [Pseudomonas viridiflava]|uniref:hypothetical protein n=1 Tax=Pseudomonas viridiflava TaxID=33069 RepID=UPI000F01AEF5|nr:hypothetical protein [Pseudomonas viridiflava]